jgi:HEAT repeat protein
MSRGVTSMRAATLVLLSLAAVPPLFAQAPSPALAPVVTVQGSDLFRARVEYEALTSILAPVAVAGRSLFDETWRPEQGTPEDSLYKMAREALNRGEYARASTLFKSLEQKYPRSRVAPAALYYQAFSLYRAGATEELKAAIEALGAQQQRYPEAAADPDAASLKTRILAALAARGDQSAAAALRAASAGGPTCDREDVEVRAEALNALAQLSPGDARATLKKVLARRDECSVTLRRRAVYILGRSGTQDAAADLLEVARSDPDGGVRSDAIGMIGRAAGSATVKTLETLFNESPDDRVRQAILSSLRNRGDADSRRVLRTIIERGDVPERLRAQAISQLGTSGNLEHALVSEIAAAQAAGRTITTTGVPTPSGQSRRITASGNPEDAAYLRALYAKSDSRTIKSAIISTAGRMGGPESDQWLLGIARNKDEEMTLRREALYRLRTSALSVDDISKLFESLSERELRSALVSQLGNRDEPAAVDKLIEIVKSGTDPQLRRQAIGILSRKNDPRTTKLLLDLVEKP